MVIVKFSYIFVKGLYYLNCDSVKFCGWKIMINRKYRYVIFL